MSKVLSLLRRKPLRGTTLSKRNQKLADQINDFIPRDYIYITNGSKFVDGKSYDFPSHIIGMRTTARFDAELERTRISLDEATFYAEKSMIISKDLVPSPEDELKDFLKHWLCVDYLEHFGEYPEPAKINKMTTEEIIALYQQLDSRYTRDYLAKLAFEERERRIISRGWTENKTGYLVLTMANHRDYATYAYGSDGEEYAVTINCQPICHHHRNGKKRYLTDTNIGTCGLVPLKEAPDYSLY